MTSDVKCPRWNCGRANSAVNAFCYYCGAILGEWANTGLEPRTSLPVHSVSARLKLPDNRQISLASQAQWIGRDNLNGILPVNDVTYISRRHFIIGVENGQYYVEDHDSTNGTRLNGTEIKGKGKFKLSNGDLIEVADVVTMSYEMS